MIYKTYVEESIDEICYRILGTEVGNLELTLSLNRHIAKLPLLLPIGTTIVLPDRSEEPAEEEIKLWD